MKKIFFAIQLGLLFALCSYAQNDGQLQTDIANAERTRILESCKNRNLHVDSVLITGLKYTVINSYGVDSARHAFLKQSVADYSKLVDDLRRELEKDSIKFLQAANEYKTDPSAVNKVHYQDALKDVNEHSGIVQLAVDSVASWRAGDTELVQRLKQNKPGTGKYYLVNYTLALWLNGRRPKPKHITGIFSADLKMMHKFED